VLILFIKAFLSKGKLKASAAFKLMFSALRTVKYISDCNTCFVAVLEAAAANFCKPTSESLFC
jgi:hypothetical protein